MPALRRDDALLRLTKEMIQVRAALRSIVGNIPLFDLSSQNTPAQITGDQNNYAIGDYDLLRLSSDAARTITGLAEGLRGRYLRLFNIGAFTITLSHQSGSSAIANRFKFSAATNYSLTAGSSVLVYYDDVQSRWIDAGGGGGGTSVAGDGWIAESGTWSYSSADAPTFVASVNKDMTSIVSIGMRVKLTQTSAKYFIITGVGSYSAGATLITLYGGTDYTLTNAAISSPYYSTAKAPLGFPLDPSKWTVSVTDTTVRWYTPTNNTWAVPTGSTANLAIPIGAWKVTASTISRSAQTTGTYTNSFTTLSTTNNSETDSSSTWRVSGDNRSAETTQFPQASILLTSKTTYYLLHRVYNDGALTANCGFDGTSTIKAVCAYL